MSNFRNQTFDDRDTGNLKYQGSWFLTGSWNASNVGETGTLSSTSDIEANVTFTFPVPAIAFYYYGIRRCCGGLYGICIDCDPNNPVFIPIDAVNTTDDGKNPPVVLYSMTFKQPGVHEIIIRNENDTRFGKSQITLDRIDLEVVDDSVSPTSSSVSPTSSGVSSGSFTTATGSSTTSVAPVASSSAPLAPVPPVGAIAGGVVGGTLLIIALAVYFLFARRRRQKVTVAPAPRNSLLTPSRSEPFLDPFPHSPTATASRLEMQQTPVLFRSPGDPGYGYVSGKERKVRPPPASASSFSSASRSTDPQSLPSMPTPVRELDAGPVDFTDDDAQSTLPPEYTQVFPRVRYLPPIPNSQQVAEESAPSTSDPEMEGPLRHENLSPRPGKS